MAGKRIYYSERRDCVAPCSNSLQWANALQSRVCGFARQLSSAILFARLQDNSSVPFCQGDDNTSSIGICF